MSFAISAEEDLAEAVHRIADEELGKAIGAMSDLGGTTAEINHTVHFVRKRCKKLRGLLRLVRDALGDVYPYENAAIRDAAKMLAGFRDSQVILETHDAIVERFGDAVDRNRLNSVRARLASLLDRPVDPETKASSQQALDDALLSLRSVRARVDGWLGSGVSESALRKGIERTYKRARKGLSAARHTGGPGEFHEFRKRVKYHWYHAKLIAKYVYESSKGRRKKLKKLSDVLGDAHDLAVYETTLARFADDEGLAAATILLSAVSRGRRSELERDALTAGEDLFYLSPGTFVSRLGL